MSRACLQEATSGQRVCLSNHPFVGGKRSDTLKNEGWKMPERVADVIDTPQHEQRTPEWYEAREECSITGSIVDTLLDNNPFSTYHQEVNRVAGLRPDPETDWNKKRENGVVKYKNPDQTKIDLGARACSKLYTTWPHSSLYVILDIEHTEGCYEGIHIIQLAAKLADNNCQTLDTFNELVSTSRPIVDRCGHNITKTDLEGKETFDKVGQRFIDWMAQYLDATTTVMFVAYNGFTCDFRILAREFERNHLVLPKHHDYLCIDPLKYVEKEKKVFFKDIPERTEIGQPRIKLKDVTTFILTERERYHEDRERYQVGDVLFENLCGKAHDAMADVEALHIVLTDPTVWDHRGEQMAIKFDNFTQYAVEFVHYERELAVIPPVHESNMLAIKHGNDYEEDAIDTYIRDHFKGKCKYIELGFVKHPYCSYMGASPDALLLFMDRPPILLEIKCPYRVYESGGKLDRFNLNKYRGQVQLQMHVMGVYESHFIQYNPEPYELIFEVVRRDADFMKNPIFPKFMDDVEARKTRNEDVVPPEEGEEDEVVPLPKRKKSSKRIVIEESDDDG